MPGVGGEQGFILSLLQLLFGQTGALGTVLIASNIYSAWLYYQEKQDHKETQKHFQEVNERRTELLETYANSIRDVKQSIDLLAARTQRIA